MDRNEIAKWDEARWEAELERIMEEARPHFHGKPNEQVLVVKTKKGNLYIAELPDFMAAAGREAENFCIRTLVENHDTEVFCCAALLKQQSLIIPSWNFRKQLLEIHPKNEETALFLQGFGCCIVKPLKNTLPPKKGADNSGD